MSQDEPESRGLSPAASCGLGVLFVLNIAMLASLPPVLRGRGAPYLPTFKSHREAMFRQLQQTVGRKKEVFVDLGSGDGRLVFAAAQTFRLSIGYESNPFLYVFSQGQRFVRGPKYWASTRFYWQDLWTADLSEVDVVAVYGLGPIMKDLGAKLEKELPSGALVVSNVFSVPGWTAVSSLENTHIYKIR